MMKSGNTNRCLVYILMMGLLAALLILLNLQIFTITNYFNEPIKPALAAQSTDVPSQSGITPAAHTAHNVDPAKSMLETVEQQLSHRTKIDDFLAPELWKGASSSRKGSVTITGGGQFTEAYRKYDGLLPLGTYLYLDIEAAGLGSVDWMTLYLMEDQSYSNYFEFDLLQALREGRNELVINKRDITTGSGTPRWDSISTVRIAFGADEDAKASITLGEISTYEASAMCSIWFDDGWKTTYTDAYPVMKEKGFKGILSVVSSYVGCTAFCTEDDLKEMYAYGWDLTNHTDRHQNLTEVSPEEAEAGIVNCFDYLESKGFTRASRNMVPPYCAADEETDGIIAGHAVTSRVRWSAYNYLPVTDPYHLGFREVFSDTSPETVKGWIDEAIENDLWLVLLFHSIEPPADGPTKYSKDKFEKIIGCLDEKRSDIRVVTISEILDADIIKDFSPQTYGQSEYGLKLVFEDGFDGALDNGVWNIVEAEPFKNNELQTYTKSAVSVKDGILNITSGREAKGYISGAVTTENKQLFQYGRIEIRAKLPSGKGIFPAFWLLPQSGDSYPEIDIIEYLGDEPDSVWHVMHYKKGGKYSFEYDSAKSGFDQDFHVFAVEWAKDGLKWFVDGALTYSVSENIPSGKMYLYLNTAIGGDWPGNPGADTQFPQTMLIDYVKYYA